MKRNIISYCYIFRFPAKAAFFLICFLFFNFLYSQTPTTPPESSASNPTMMNGFVFDNIMPKISSPEASSFKKVGFTEVEKSTGRANISIPLYTVKCGDLIVPISLSYDTGGVNVNAPASNVGLNWSLNAGGQVKKTVKGYEDFMMTFKGPWRENTPLAENITYEDFCTNDMSKLDYITGHHFSNVSKLGWMLQKRNISIKNYFDNNSNSCVDKSFYGEDRWSFGADPYPDMFSVSAPGLSTSFFHDSEGNVVEIDFQSNTINTTIGKSDYIPFFQKIDNPAIPNSAFRYDSYDGPGNKRILCVNNIEVTNLKGVRYKFDKLDVLQYADRNGVNVLDAGITANHDQKLTQQQVSAYHITSMTDIGGKKIEFQYESYQLLDSDYYKNQVQNKNLDQNTLSVSGQPVREVKYPRLNRIKKITFDEGSVVFQYNQSRSDLRGGKALTDIIVKNIQGQPIKHYSLDYSYFISSNNCTLPTCKRLKLVSLTEKDIHTVGNLNDQVYNFTYNSTPLPERGANNCMDFLGYANRLLSPNTSYLNSSTNSIYPSYYTIYDTPPIIYYSPNKGENSFLPFEVYSNNSYSTTGRSLISSENYTKANILTQIEHPTGGITKYQYELNRFLIGGAQISGGGLRLKSQKLYSSTGELANELKYEYKSDNGTSSGRLENPPNYGMVFYHGDDNITNYSPNQLSQLVSNGQLDLRLFSSPRNDLDYTNGGYVLYGKVTVYQKQKNTSGYTEYKYTTSDDYPDLTPAFSDMSTSPSGGGGLNQNNAPEIYFGYQNGQYFPFRGNMSTRRGKLLSKEVFDNNGISLKRTEHEYDYKLFETIETPVKTSRGELVPMTGLMLDQELFFMSKMYSHRNLIDKDIITEKFDEGNISTIISKTYADYFPMILESSKNLSSGDTYKTQYFYPFQGNVPIEFLDVHLFSEVVKERSFKNDQLIYEIKKYYNDSPILPSEVRILKKYGGNFKSYLYHKYDLYGKRPLEISTSDGPHIVYIWNQSKENPIAKIENATFLEVANALGISEDDLEELDEADISTINGLRNNSSLSKAMITTYTYAPLIGMKSQTDPGGYTTYYNYDDFNRLEYIKDDEGKVLKEYNYNYRD